MDESERREMAGMLAGLAEAAGRLVLETRAAGATFARKPDGSPVSDADLRCEGFLIEALGRALPELPVLGEESAAAGHRPRGERFLLVDPLDGTREFMTGSDDFTINIALIEAGAPTLGILHAPAHGRLFSGWSREAWEQRPAEALRRRIRVASRASEDCAPGIVALTSRSHLDATTAALLARIAPTEIRAFGSAFKFGLIAAGEADLYPRFAPTMGWDTAAGQAVLEAAGGVVLAADGSRLSYSLEELCNPGFVAAASPALARRALEAAAS